MDEQDAFVEDICNSTDKPARILNSQEKITLDCNHQFDRIGTERQGYLTFAVSWCSLCGTIRTGYYGDKFLMPKSSK